ncbi:uncharacterized protein LOC111613419 isoform X2 [Centruroides sculpturatus]|nr:uncharacterized protein LOC111613419 isoform X2 [Centruroides sculpturatus]
MKKVGIAHLGLESKRNYYCMSEEKNTAESASRKDVVSACKERVRNYYQTEFECMRSFCFEGNIYDFPIKDYYFDLPLEKALLFEGNVTKKVKSQELFADKHNRYQSILVSGNPGYGKSTLCKKIAYDWSCDGNVKDYVKHFDLVVVISLSHLGTTNVKDAVFDKLFPESRKEAKEILEAEELNLLVILDGFDETTNKKSVLKFIRKDSFYISSNDDPRHQSTRSR